MVSQGGNGKARPLWGGIADADDGRETAVEPSEPRLVAVAAIDANSDSRPEERRCGRKRRSFRSARAL